MQRTNMAELNYIVYRCGGYKIIKQSKKIFIERVRIVFPYGRRAGEIDVLTGKQSQ